MEYRLLGLYNKVICVYKVLCYHARQEVYATASDKLERMRVKNMMELAYSVRVSAGLSWRFFVSAALTLTACYRIFELHINRSKTSCYILF